MRTLRVGEMITATHPSTIDPLRLFRPSNSNHTCPHRRNSRALYVGTVSGFAAACVGLYAMYRKDHRAPGIGRDGCQSLVWRYPKAAFERLLHCEYLPTYIFIPKTMRIV